MAFSIKIYQLETACHLFSHTSVICMSGVYTHKDISIYACVARVLESDGTRTKKTRKETL